MHSFYDEDTQQPDMQISGYRIEKTIGEGGMATAYLAVQESLGRLAVLKVLNTNNRDSKENVERFLNEGRIVASLNHPNIITIYDIGIAEDFMYISMEYIEGGDLRQRLKHPISEAESLEIIKKICSGLDIAHRKGIVHRDVKPGNILFRKNGEPLLTDFGIAKRLTMENDLTSTGVFLGSPNYMAPEQAEDGPIDGRADIYALGVIFYEMLTGQKPYRSESVIDVIVKHKQAPVPTLPEEYEKYQPLLNLMMAKKRKNRFRDANSVLHFIHHLEKIEKDKLAEENEVVPQKQSSTVREKTIPTYMPEQTTRRTKTRRWLTWGLSFTMLASASVFAILVYLQTRPAPVIDKSDTPQFNIADLPEIALFPPIPAVGSTPKPQTGEEDINEVTRALGWLARKSLEEQRLIEPEKDNAYYYYVRLLEINPEDVQARHGLKSVAEQMAYRAEKSLADNNYPQAERYIHLGLQINPESETLNQLRALTVKGQSTFMDQLKAVLKPE